MEALREMDFFSLKKSGKNLTKRKEKTGLGKQRKNQS